MWREEQKSAGLARTGAATSRGCCGGRTLGTLGQGQGQEQEPAPVAVAVAEALHLHISGAAHSARA